MYFNENMKCFTKEMENENHENKIVANHESKSFI